MTDIRTFTPMTKARAEVVMMDPFFGTLLLRMRMKEDPTCRTAWTDGVTIGYNPDYIAKLDHEERKGLLVHEIMHPVLMHHLRRNNRDPKMWNIACDYALNPMIADRYKLPEGALNDPIYRGKSADEIYNMLPKQSGGGSGDNDPGNSGEVRDNPQDKNQSQAQSDKQAEAEWKQNIAQAAHIARVQGKLPAHIAKLVEEVLEPVVDWKRVLRRFVSETARAEESWNKPQRRLVAENIYLPGLHNERVGPLVICRDTSGSIYCDRDALAQFNGEITSIAVDVKPSKIIIIDCDANVQQVFEIDPGEDMPEALNKAQGGGGTSFVPPFSWLEEQNINPKCVIYLTDGYGTFPKEEDVSVPTMWVMTTDVEPPFGERIQL